MTTVAESIPVISRALLRTYPRMGDVQAEEFCRHLGKQNAEQVCTAIDRHILSAAGQWPPVPGQILAQLRDMEIEARRTGPAPSLWGTPIVVDVPVGMRAYWSQPTVEVYPVTCMDCGDSGMARWYYTWDDDQPRRVYLTGEIERLPAALMAKLRVAVAVCSCEAGQGRPERDQRVTRRHRGAEITMDLYPRLEGIRRLAERRRGRDLRDVA